MGKAAKLAVKELVMLLFTLGVMSTGKETPTKNPTAAANNVVRTGLAFIFILGSKPRHRAKIHERTCRFDLHREWRRREEDFN